eukprot:100385-Chlamydomonas_euryale.AAC.20
MLQAQHSPLKYFKCNSFHTSSCNYIPPGGEPNHQTTTMPKWHAHLAFPPEKSPQHCAVLTLSWGAFGSPTVNLQTYRTTSNSPACISRRPRGADPDAAAAAAARRLAGDRCCSTLLSSAHASLTCSPCRSRKPAPLAVPPDQAALRARKMCAAARASASAMASPCLRASLDSRRARSRWPDTNALVARRKHSWRATACARASARAPSYSARTLSPESTTGAPPAMRGPLGRAEPPPLPSASSCQKARDLPSRTNWALPAGWESRGDEKPPTPPLPPPPPPPPLTTLAHMLECAAHCCGAAGACEAPSAGNSLGSGVSCVRGAASASAVARRSNGSSPSISRSSATALPRLLPTAASSCRSATSL